LLAYPTGTSVFNTTDGLLYRLSAKTGQFENLGIAFPVSAFCTKAMLNNAGSGTGFAQAAGPLTAQVQTVLESDFIAVQIGVVHIDTAAGSMKGCVLPWAAAQADNSAAANYNSATWTDLTQTINGVSSATAVLTAMPATIAGQGLVSWFDPVPIASLARTDSGKTLPGISVRLEWLAGTNWAYLPGPFTSPAVWETDSAANAGRFYRVRGQAVSAGQNATKAALTNTATWTFCPPILIRYWPKRGLPRTIVFCGDSIDSASGGTGSAVNLARYGFPQMLQAQFSTPANPIEIVDCGLGGATVANISTMMNTVIPAIPNAVAVYPNATPNGTGGTLSATDVSTWTGFKAKMRLLCEQNRVASVIRTMLPVGTAAKAWGATDSFRQNMNADDVASGQVIFDAAGVLSGAVVSGQTQLTNTADNVHPDDSGNAALAVSLGKILGIG
jgi:hypothetical protein